MFEGIEKSEEQLARMTREMFQDTKYIAAVMFCLGVVVGIFIVRLAQ